MNVIVTGGSGRAGREVVRAVADAGHQVVNLDAVPPAPELRLPGAYCRVDLTDAGAVYDAFCQYRPEGVCHLAANPSPRVTPRSTCSTPTSAAPTACCRPPAISARGGWSTPRARWRPGC